MPVYNIRCCCQPTKILGTLELPTRYRDGETCYVLEQRGPWWKQDPTTADVITAVPSAPNIKFRAFGGNHEIAIYSDDRPIEFWRKIVGFRENEAVTS